MLVEVKVGLKRDGLKKDGGSGRGWDWSWRKILDASEEYSAATEGFASAGGSELIHVSSLGHDDCATVSIGAPGRFTRCCCGTGDCPCWINRDV